MKASCLDCEERHFKCHSECEKYIDEAYRLISVVWKDFEENRDEYMKYFNQYLRDYDLAEYIK